MVAAGPRAALALGPANSGSFRFFPLPFPRARGGAPAFMACLTPAPPLPLLAFLREALPSLQLVAFSSRRATALVSPFSEGTLQATGSRASTVTAVVAVLLA